MDRQNFVQSFLSQGIRKDGRHFDSVRPTVVNVNSLRHTDGSAVVSIGETMVVCGIKAELAKPKPERPSQGFLVLNVELPTLCSPQSQPGPPSDEAQAASTFLSHVFEEALNLETLCLAVNRLSWVLYLDIVCLNHDGGLIEAATYAATAALNNTKLPFVAIDVDTGAITVNAKQRIPLKLNYLPYGASFAVFDRLVVQDPTAEEEAMSGEILTVITGTEVNAAFVYNPGSRPMAATDITKCRSIARTRALKLDKLLKAAQEND